MAANPYEINYDDKRFSEVETDKKAALTDVEKTYGGMINQSDKYYDNLVNQSKDWADKQAQIQNEQTDFAIEKTEQQKEQAEQDYIKEQAGAYADWQKESDKYGVNAEIRAQNGLMSATGYNASLQANLYNTYQNRVATARDVFARATLNYDNNIKEAKLQNSAALAEIYANSYKEQLELALEGFKYKNQLVLEKANKKLEVDNMYYGRYQDVLSQINTENALAEQVRQYNESKALEEKKLAEETRQYNESMKLQQAQFAWQKAQAAKSSSGGGSSSGGYINKNNKKPVIKVLEAKNSENKNKEATKKKLMAEVDNGVFTTSQQAKEFLKANSIKTGNVKMLTEKEWIQAQKNKGNYSETEYITYQEYLKNWVAWRIEESY